LSGPAPPRPDRNRASSYSLFEPSTRRSLRVSLDQSPCVFSRGWSLPAGTALVALHRAARLSALSGVLSLPPKHRALFLSSPRACPTLQAAVSICRFRDRRQ